MKPSEGIRTRNGKGKRSEMKYRQRGAGEEPCADEERGAREKKKKPPTFGKASATGELRPGEIYVPTEL